VASKVQFPVASVIAVTQRQHNRLQIIKDVSIRFSAYGCISFSVSIALLPFWTMVTFSVS
jgi:hypothetical protein